MSTISATTHRTAGMNLFIVSAIVVVAALAFAVVSSIVVPKPSLIPVTGNQNAYVDFLRGEKEFFSGRIELGNGLSTYHAGEKTVYASAVDADNALWVYRLGEKSAPTNIESALLQYRLGEKNAK